MPRRNAPPGPAAAHNNNAAAQISFRKNMTFFLSDTKIQLALISLFCAMLLGGVPRVGFELLPVAIYGRLVLHAERVSQRTDFVENLIHALSTLKKDQYIVVAGPKGVGKTCIVSTAMEGLFDVVYVRVPSATPEEKILSDVYNAITRCSSHLANRDSASRVMWWHKAFFRTPMTVVLQATEREADEKFAALSATARTLTQNYPIHVIIDGSDNSMPSKPTLRERWIEVGPMELDVIMKVPELTSLHANLNATNLTDVVWACLGGNPAIYLLLDTHCQNVEPKDLELVVTKFLHNVINKAIAKKRENVIENKPFKKLYELFREQTEIPSSMLETMELKRPSPDKVLREVQLPSSLGENESMLIPADAAMALVLRFDLKRAPTLQKLKEMAGAK